MAGDLRVEYDPQSFARFIKGTKAFSPTLAKQLRSRLRKAGQNTVRDMRATIGGGEMRGQIARGVRVSIRAGARVQGVFIESTGSGMDAGRRGMHRTWNRPSFRHPVYGGPAWVSQSGHPYFQTTIARHEGEMRTAVIAALADAAKEMQ